MLIYLIGPSAVGKSAVARNVAALSPSFSYVDLDDLMRAKDPVLFNHNGNRWQDFWELARRCFLELEAAPSNQKCLVDVGAGCLKTIDALKYFAQQSVVAILDEPANSFRRAQARPGGYWSSRTLDEYSREEYSLERRQFYDAARHKVEVNGLDEQAATRKFSEVLARVGAT